MKGKHWGLILTIACMLSFYFELYSYAQSLYENDVSKQVEVTVDKAHKPVYPVGTFEYEHKRTI